MGSEWIDSQLSDFINIKHGFAFKGEFFKDSETADCLMTPGNFAVGGGFKGDKLKYYSGPVPEDYVLNKDDLVVTMTDLSKEADTLGYSALVPEINGKRLLHNQRVGLVQFKNDELDKTYLYFLLRSREYRHHVVSGATGTTVKHTSPTKIVSFEFKNPPKHIQVDIGQYLLRIEHKITLNRQLNQTLEHMAQALFKSWFVDFDPVIDNALAAGNVIPDDLQDRAERRQLQLAKADHKPLPENIRKLFPSKFELTESLGWVPKGWCISNVGECFDVTMGQSPPGSTYNEDRIGLPFFQGRTDFGFRYPANRIYCTEPKRLGKKGHTLISVRAPVGDINIAVEDCCIGRGVASAIHKSGATSYTYYSMNQLSEHFKIFEGEGTVFGSINQKDFNAIPLLKQPEQIIKEFEKIAGNFDKKIRLCSESINALSQLRDTLLPKLISGELRIPEAESALTLALSQKERGLESASE